MIRGRVELDGKPALLIGLSRENTRRLLDDKPIVLHADDLVRLGLPGVIEIVIIAGETEAAMSKMLGGMPLQPEGEQVLRQKIDAPFVLEHLEENT